MCVQNAAGITDFRAFKAAIKNAPERLVLFAFDLLMSNGRDLRAEPLTDRRRRLCDLIGAVERLGTPRARLASLVKRRQATWIKAGLTARVRHLRGEDMLRHATLQSLNTSGAAADDVGERHEADE